jgi:hypothetical protein
MGSLQCGQVRFVAYPGDHEPRHVHGFAGASEAIVDLQRNGVAVLARRKKAVKPANAKRSDVRNILTAAQRHFDELVQLWEAMHE